MGGRLRWNSQWLDALPENLADNPTADRLRTICEPDLSELASAEPPQGYGRLSLLLQASTRSDLTPNAVDRKPPIQAITEIDQNYLTPVNVSSRQTVPSLM